MDVKSVFLNGDLIEKVYMQVASFTWLWAFSSQSLLPCHALYDYGFKQSPCVRFLSFVITHQGFVPRSYDSTMFLWTTDEVFVIMLLYVDDMIIIENDIFEIRSFQNFLSQNFGMKDWDRPNYFLGLEVTSSTYGCYF